MANLQSIWIERDPETDAQVAVRIDWDNDRHQRIALSSTDAASVTEALYFSARLVRSELANGEI